MDTQGLYGVAQSAAESSPAGPRRRTLRIGVLVSLMQHPAAGGHVRCWERLAQAALGRTDEIDLTGPLPGT